jgi:spermidine synthase
VRRVPLLAAAVLSGSAALLYQLLWARQLSVVFGNAVEAVATVVATFMAGLGLGAAVAAQIVDRAPPRTLRRAYAGLEIGIAALGLLVPWASGRLLPWLQPLYRPDDPDALTFVLVRGLASALLLLPPTLLMGATLPALTPLLAQAPQTVSRDSGRLYALNTAGALCGSLGGALVLIPALGLRGTTLVAVALNVGAAALVLVASAEGPPQPEEASVPSLGPARDEKRRKRKASSASLEPAPERVGPLVPLAATFLAGLAALANEVGWTRALVLLIGPTSFAFAFVVSAVIAGVALGSALAARLAQRARRPVRVLFGLLACSALASLAVAAAIPRAVIPLALFVRAHADEMSRLLWTEAGLVLALLIVPASLSGASFPLAVRLLADARGGLGRPVGRVLSWNTAGGIVGSLLAGFVALPRLGLEASLYAAALVAAGAAALVLTSGSRRPPALAAAVFVLAAPFVARRLAGPWDRELLASGAYKYAAYATSVDVEGQMRAGDLLFYREGSAATVSVKRLGGTLSLAVDGKVDATDTGDMLTQRLLAHLPLLLHAEPREVLVIGLGSGVTAASTLTHAGTRVDAVEISREVAQAAELFRHVNGDVLRNPRLRLIVGDGRSHLRLASKRYDVIISEPSNPWMAGVSGLFTRDFFRMARERLAPGGLFCQWAHVYNLREADLQTVVASFTDAFAHSALFLLDEGDLLMLGGEAPIEAPSPEALRLRWEAPAVRADLEAVEVRDPYAFGRLFTIGGPALARWALGAERHTDDRPVLDLRAPRSIHSDTGPANAQALAEAAAQAGPPASWSALVANPSAKEVAARAHMLEMADSFGWAYLSYSDALTRDPTLLPAIEGLVRTGVRSGRGGGAESRLRELRPSAAAHVGLALLFNSTGRSPEALQETRLALEKDPRNLRALLLAAEIQEEAGNAGAMRRLASEALRQNPGDLDAEAFLASSRLAEGNLDEALAEAERVLARDPRQPRALQVCAIALAGKGDRDRARTFFEALVAAEPDEASHRTNLGIFELEGGRPEVASRHFESALDLDPTSERGARGLESAARALGNPALLARAQAILSRTQARQVGTRTVGPPTR